MARLFILAFLSLNVRSFAQQKLADSLLRELNNHQKSDTGWLSLSNKLSVAYRSIDPHKALLLADSNIALANQYHTTICLPMHT